MSRSKQALATAGVAVAIAAGAGSAVAGGGAGGHGPGPGASTAVATYLGLTPAELRAQLQAGKSLAQIARAQGKSVTGLEDAIYDEAKEHLDADVAAGRITAAQEQARLAELKSHLDGIVNRVGPPPGGPGAHHGAPFGDAAAAYIGITAAQLRTELEAGRSLAQVSAAHGKTAAGLKAALLADAKKHLDADVKAGRLTRAQADARLAELKSRIDDLVDRTGPPTRP